MPRREIDRIHQNGTDWTAASTFSRVNVMRSRSATKAVSLRLRRRPLSVKACVPAAPRCGQASAKAGVAQQTANRAESSPRDPGRRAPPSTHRRWHPPCPRCGRRWRTTAQGASRKTNAEPCPIRAVRQTGRRHEDFAEDRRRPTWLRSSHPPAFECDRQLPSSRASSSSVPVRTIAATM